MNCKECTKNVLNERVPVYVLDQDRIHSKHDKLYLYIIIIILIVALVGSNLAWIIYNAQFDDVVTSVEMDNERGYNSYIGNDGDIYNVKAESNDEETCP